MAKTKRKITLMAPFENVSAKFALVRDRAGINNGGIKYFGARNINVIGQGMVNNFYLRKYGRSTQPSTKELKLREIFAGSVQGANHIMADLTQLSNVVHMFADSLKDPMNKRCNGIAAKSYTMRGWVRAVQYAGGYKAYTEGGSYDYNKFPTAFDA